METVDDFYEFLCKNNINYLFVDIGEVSSNGNASNIINSVEMICVLN